MSKADAVAGSQSHGDLISQVTHVLAGELPMVPTLAEQRELPGEDPLKRCNFSHDTGGLAPFLYETA